MKKSIFHYALSALFVGAAALSATSCADDDINPNGGTDGDALVRFSINDVQEQAVSRGLEMTRGAIATGLSNADLAGGRLEAHNNAGLDVCLIETTVEGVNPIKADARTRADIIKTATLGDFSVSAIRGTTATSILTTPEWFHAKKTKKNGELYSPIRWAFSQPYARFFAVYPNTESYSKMTIGNTETSGSPSVDFEVDSDVKNQKDFMTACTGDVHYATRGVHPTTSLDFRHALTGIRFAVGQNLSWNKIIDKVEIQNAVMKSKYTLSKDFNGTGAAWDHSADTRGTATLSGVSVSTSKSPNTTIMGNAGDNFTFYMIPQVLTGKNVKVNVHCTDGTVIDVVLKGEWKAATTRTYKLSQTNSNWNYVLTATDPSRAAEYNETTSQPYSITSYREDPVTHTKQAVAWKVIGYSEDNGATWTTNKPTWLTALSSESGNGGTAAEAGTATLTKDVKDLLKERNDGLKNATALGSSSAPYDLSTKGGSESRSTANSYVISAPGHYRIPLVYGNAIKNGNYNPSSYQTSHTGTTILSKFQDHAGNAINDPWIEKTNGGANSGVDGAEVVWADADNLVHSPSITRVGGEGFLDFEVTAADIQSGNAVVAVTKSAGAGSKTVLWSWHLWFAPKDALDKIEVTNHQGVKYNFTKEALGWKLIQWSGSTYSSARTVKVKVEQTVANNGTKQEAVINITQNPGSVKKGATTLYQFGRKDAFPGVDETQLPQGSINKNAGDNMSITNGIQHPNFYYTGGSNWNSNYGYYNLWSADNTVTGGSNVGNDNPVVKTVYDPSPVGFKMPANNAFTGFTANGQNEGTMNVDGTNVGQTFSNNFGHNFWTSSSKTATIYFPASGFRFSNGGALNDVGNGGYYWSAVPNGLSNGCDLFFHFFNVVPLSNDARSFGFSVRPVSE
ncbi:hypothetical protein [Prevotella nigrescens]|uniref:hypothetical protein n=1 Tax=Prevotella nigrescens TaxID=28133 RepID=UPI0002AE86F0|nr:hypothetical protein [Prevotella nigrescens]ELX66721.1 hypothetical protein HMPREF0662_02035 [Prevotella nigrescens F0103]QUB54561.1 hypothetical protein J4865_04110 [Prevotella nigrescens F0103]